MEKNRTFPGLPRVVLSTPMEHNQSFELPPPEHGKIRFILYRPAKSSDSLFLEIPTSIPSSSCLRPRKYLRYLGWCVLGVEGRVWMDFPHVEHCIGDEGPLEDQGVYRYYTYELENRDDSEGLTSSFISTSIISL